MPYSNINTHLEPRARTFHEELTALINTHSVENISNTPDFILAKFMHECLNAFEQASKSREAWYGKFHSPGELHGDE